MNTILIIVILGVAVAVFLVARNSSASSAVKVKLDDVPRVFEKLQETRKNANFAVFCFEPPRAPSLKQAVNIQFSIEDGRIGLDWVLLGPTNIQDQGLFLELARGRGYHVVERELNNVKYLRIEDGDLPVLCQATMREIYSVSEDTKLILIPRGFKWPKAE